MKRILRILPLAMALGALSALGGASSGERAAGNRGDTDVAARNDASVVSSALVRLSMTAIPIHAMSADFPVANLARSPLAGYDVLLGKRTLPLASEPLAGAATPRAPTR
jgi:hypothetical protein